MNYIILKLDAPKVASSKIPGFEEVEASVLLFLLRVQISEERASRSPLPPPTQSRIFSPVENRFQTSVPTRYRATATLKTSFQEPGRRFHPHSAPNREITVMDGQEREGPLACLVGGCIRWRRCRRRRPALRRCWTAPGALPGRRRNGETNQMTKPLHYELGLNQTGTN